MAVEQRYREDVCSHDALHGASSVGYEARSAWPRPRRAHAEIRGVIDVHVTCQRDGRTRGEPRDLFLMLSQSPRHMGEYRHVSSACKDPDG